MQPSLRATIIDVPTRFGVNRLSNSTLIRLANQLEAAGPDAGNLPEDYVDAVHGELAIREDMFDQCVRGFGLVF